MSAAKPELCIQQKLHIEPASKTAMDIKSGRENLTAAAASIEHSVLEIPKEFLSKWFAYRNKLEGIPKRNRKKN